MDATLSHHPLHIDVDHLDVERGDGVPQIALSGVGGVAEHAGAKFAGRAQQVPPNHTQRDAGVSDVFGCAGIQNAHIATHPINRLGGKVSRRIND